MQVEYQEVGYTSTRLARDPHTELVALALLLGVRRPQLLPRPSHAHQMLLERVEELVRREVEILDDDPAVVLLRRVDGFLHQHLAALPDTDVLHIHTHTLQQTSLIFSIQ